MKYLTLMLLLVANQAFGQVLYPPFQTTVVSDLSYTWTPGDLSPYMSRIPVMSQYDWSRPWETKEKILARTVANGFTSAQEWNVVYIEAVDCDDNGPDSDTDGTRLDQIGTLGGFCPGGNCASGGKEGTLFILKNEDDQGPQTPCYYNWIGSTNVGYSNIHIAGQGYTITKLVHGETPDGPSISPSVPLSTGTSWTNQCGAIQSTTYSGSLVAGAQQVLLNNVSGFTTGDPVWISGTDQDNEQTSIGTFITDVSGNTITIFDPIPAPFSTITSGGTVSECSKQRQKVFYSDLHMYAGYASRGACSSFSGSGCSFQLEGNWIELYQHDRVMFNNVVIGPTYRSPIVGARTTNVIFKHGGFGEYLASSRRGTRTGMISEVAFSSTYRFYDFWMDTGFGRIIGNDAHNGNHYLGFMYKASPLARGTYITGINTGHSSPSTLSVTDTGDYCTGINTTDTWFPKDGSGLYPERDIYHHGDTDGVNAMPWVIESANLACNVVNEYQASGNGRVGRYHTLHRIRSVFNSSAAGGLLATQPSVTWANWNVLFSKFRERNLASGARSTTLGVNNIFGSILDGGVLGTDINTDTGAGANDACSTSNDPPSVVLRQSEPPCFWCAEFGNSTNNYGWNGSWDMGSCDASNNVQIPAEIKWRIFNGEALTCTPPPNCVDY